MSKKPSRTLQHLDAAVASAALEAPIPSGSDPVVSGTYQHSSPTASTLREKAAGNPMFLLSREQVEDMYGLWRRWLELAAWRGHGPPIVKISRRMVRYRVGDIEAWLSKHAGNLNPGEEG